MEKLNELKKESKPPIDDYGRTVADDNAHAVFHEAIGIKKDKNIATDETIDCDEGRRVGQEVWKWTSFEWDCSFVALREYLSQQSHHQLRSGWRGQSPPQISLG